MNKRGGKKIYEHESNSVINYPTISDGSSAWS